MCSQFVHSLLTKNLQTVHILRISAADCRHRRYERGLYEYTLYDYSGLFQGTLYFFLGQEPGILKVVFWDKFIPPGSYLGS